MKKILFTIQWYPSVLSANALCDTRIISALLEKSEEYEVHCLVYKPIKGLKDEKVKGVHVHRFCRSLWWNFVIAAKTKNNNKNKIILKIDKFIMRVKQILLAPFYPISCPCLCKRFARKAIRLQKLENFDIVISEYHGEETLYAGYALKKKFPKIKFVPIFWDALAMKQPAKYLPKRFAEKRLKKQEEKIAKVADRIIQMNISEQAYNTYLIHNKCAYKYKFFGLPGVLEPIKVNGTAQFIKRGKINIIYAGILNMPERDPEPLVRTIEETKIAKEINLIFLCAGNGVEKLVKLQKEFSGDIVISSYVDREEIKKIYQEVDLFLNFGGANPNMMPSKLLEYMSYGKPIISTYYIDNDSSKRYLAEYPLACCVDTRKNTNELAREIDDFLLKKGKERVPFELVSELYKVNTPEAYVNEIHELLQE